MPSATKLLQKPIRQRSVASLVAISFMAALPAVLAACGSGNFTALRKASSSTSQPSSSPSSSSVPTTTIPSTPTTTTPAPSTTISAPASLPTPSPVQWSTCTSLAAGADTSDGKFKCGNLQVPISYSDPAAGHLSIALVELPASGSGTPKGDVVTNPGGPGGSGVDFLEQSASSFPASLRSDFNLVSFDPRGVARSDPVTCVSPAGIRALLSLNPIPVGSAQISQVVSATKAFSATCATNTSHLLLENMSTVDVAIDMDELRIALGEPKLNYLGFSYGTYLGATYAQLFPTHIRAMVLDGALNPDLTTNELDLQQAEAFEVDLDDFLTWCSGNSTCKSELPGSPSSDYHQLMSGFESGRTLPSELQPQFGGNQTVDYGVAITGVLASLYSQSDWPQLAQALQQAIGGDASDLDALALSYAGFQPNGSVENIEESNAAVNCVDHPSPTQISQYVSLAQQFAADAPDFGALEAWSPLTCVYWPVAAQRAPAPIHAPGAPPIVVVGTTHDPATPYIWAQALASQLDSGVLLTRDGDGHTAYFSSNCIQGWVDSYIETLATPPKGTVCQSNT